MKILLNGNAFDAKNQGLVSILKNFGEHIAVSINGAVAPKKTWQNVELKDGDKIEVIELVGGG